MRRIAAGLAAGVLALSFLGGSAAAIRGCPQGFLLVPVTSKEDPDRNGDGFVCIQKVRAEHTPSDPVVVDNNRPAP
jgi:hypothetical protein